MTILDYCKTKPDEPIILEYIGVDKKDYPGRTYIKIAYSTKKNCLSILASWGPLDLVTKTREFRFAMSDWDTAPLSNYRVVSKEEITMALL